MCVGSNQHELVGESLIILWTSSSLLDLKALKTGGAKVGAKVEEPEIGNLSLILFIFMQENKTNVSDMLLSELLAGRIVSELQCNIFLMPQSHYNWNIPETFNLTAELPTRTSHTFRNLVFP